MRIKDTKDSVVLDFPSLRQSTLDTCSCASVQGCLCYYGIYKREKTISNMMHVKRNVHEVHPRKMLKLLRRYGLKATYKKLSIDELVECINDGYPVIVNFQAWSDAKEPDYTKDTAGHYATVIGYDNKKRRLIFADSCSFYKTWLGYDEFELRWHDGYPNSWDYRNMGIVVKGKKPIYDSGKIIKAQ